MARTRRTTYCYVACRYALLLAIIRNDNTCSHSVLLSLQNNRERHESEHGCLQPRVFAQENGHVTHERHVAQHTSNNVLLAVEEALAARVKLRVVCRVVVTLGQKL